MGILRKKEKTSSNGTKKEAQNKKEKKVVKKVEKKSAKGKKGTQNPLLEDVLRKPRITEKATEKTADSVYVFEVLDSANKVMIREAFKQIFEVDPVKIRITRQKPRKRKRFGRKSSEKGLKKAYVYLEKGKEINIV